MFLKLNFIATSPMIMFSCIFLFLFSVLLYLVCTNWAQLKGNSLRCRVRGTVKTTWEAGYRNKVKRCPFQIFKFFHSDKRTHSGSSESEKYLMHLDIQQIFISFLLPCAKWCARGMSHSPCPQKALKNCEVEMGRH